VTRKVDESRKFLCFDFVWMMGGNASQPAAGARYFREMMIVRFCQGQEKERWMLCRLDS
jgi:hypothetical protein